MTGQDCLSGRAPTIRAPADRRHARTRRRIHAGSKRLRLAEKPECERDCNDEQAIAGPFYDECAAIVLGATDAGRILVFDHTLRSTDQPREPVMRVHNDQPYAQHAGVLTSAGNRNISVFIRFAGRDRERLEAWQQIAFAILAFFGWTLGLFVVAAFSGQTQT